MKIIEILGGYGPYDLPITNEESAFLESVKENNGLDINKLTERERRLTDLLYRRDIVYIDDNIVKFNKPTGPEFE